MNPPRLCPTTTGLCSFKDQYECHVLQLSAWRFLSRGSGGRAIPFRPHATASRCVRLKRNLAMTAGTKPVGTEVARHARARQAGPAYLGGVEPVAASASVSTIG